MARGPMTKPWREVRQEKLSPEASDRVDLRVDGELARVCEHDWAEHFRKLEDGSTFFSRHCLKCGAVYVGTYKPGETNGVYEIEAGDWSR